MSLVLSLSIVIEALSCFLAETSSVHVVDQKRAWSILGVSELLIEHFHDGQASIKTDEIGQREWAHGHIGAKLHRLVDVLGCADALVQGENRLIDVGHQDAIGDETWDVASGGACFAHLLGEGQGGG